MVKILIILIELICMFIHREIKKVEFFASCIFLLMTCIFPHYWFDGLDFFWTMTSKFLIDDLHFFFGQWLVFFGSWLAFFGLMTCIFWTITCDFLFDDFKFFDSWLAFFLPTTWSFCQWLALFTRWPFFG